MSSRGSGIDKVTGELVYSMVQDRPRPYAEEVASDGEMPASSLAGLTPAEDVVRVDALVAEMTAAMTEATAEIDRLRESLAEAVMRIGERDAEITTIRSSAIRTAEAQRQLIADLDEQLKVARSASKARLAELKSQAKAFGHIVGRLASATRWLLGNVRSCPEATDKDGHPMGWVPIIAQAWERELAAVKVIAAATVPAEQELPVPTDALTDDEWEALP